MANGKLLAARRPLLRLVPRRGYHDESFGFRKPRQYVFPDCMSRL